MYPSCLLHLQNFWLRRRLCACRNITIIISNSFVHAGNWTSHKTNRFHKTTSGFKCQNINRISDNGYHHRYNATTAKFRNLVQKPTFLFDRGRHVSTDSAFFSRRYFIFKPLLAHLGWSINGADRIDDVGNKIPIRRMSRHHHTQRERHFQNLLNSLKKDMAMRHSSSEDKQRVQIRNIRALKRTAQFLFYLRQGDTSMSIALQSGLYSNADAYLQKFAVFICQPIRILWRTDARNNRFNARTSKCRRLLSIGSILICSSSTWQDKRTSTSPHHHRCQLIKALVPYRFHWKLFKFYY